MSDPFQSLVNVIARLDKKHGTQMNDKELLELAAKAAGYDFAWYCRGANNPNGEPNVPCVSGTEWNPLDSDADALRLAVKLNIIVGMYETYANAGAIGTDMDITVWLHEVNDPYAATRRAIVLAAAEIGKNTP